MLGNMFQHTCPPSPAFAEAASRRQAPREERFFWYCLYLVKDLIKGATYNLKSPPLLFDCVIPVQTGIQIL